MLIYRSFLYLKFHTQLLFRVFFLRKICVFTPTFCVTWGVCHPLNAQNGPISDGSRALIYQE